MPDSKITALTSISTSTDPANDPLVIVDVSDTSMAATGTTKKVTLNQLLGSGGTATLASATITGDLNVSGNGAFTGTGYVALQRALNPVGENGVTSLDFRWYSTGTTYTTGARVHASSDAAWTASSTPARLMFSTVPSGSTTLSERYRIDNAGIHTWSNVGGVAGTAMTLNSTGLGVGVSPSFKGHFYSASGSNGVRLQTGSTTAGDTNRLSFQNASGASDVRTGCIEWYDVGAFKGDVRFLKAGGIQIRNSADSPTFNLDDTGNCGIGVTPAGTGGCLQLKSGITFPATQVASSDANTLDDYVEGTFTPVIQGVSTAGTGVYTAQAGRYTKIGNRVFVDIYLSWTAHTGTGAMQIANLPFTIKNVSTYFPSATFGQVNNIALTASNILTGYGTFNTKTMNLEQYPVGGGASSSVPMDPSGSIVCSICYEV